MSGGHYDYLCHFIREFADKLRLDLTCRNIKKLKNEYKFLEQTIENMKKTEKIIRAAGDLAYSIEWLMSSDTGQDDFNKDFNKIMRRLKK